MRIILILTALCFFSTNALAASLNEKAPLVAANAKESKITKISISHGGSRGINIPIYTLTLFPDGLVEYNGIQNVAIIGKAKKQIEPHAFQEFAFEFERIKFFSLKDGNLCGMAMDIPLTTISVTTDGKEKTVNYNWPCDENEALRPLVKKIEETVFAGQWEK